MRVDAFSEDVNFASAGIWGSMATWEDAKGTRRVLAPFWGPVHPRFSGPVTDGLVTHRAIVAFKVEEKNGKLQLTPAWMSRDMNQTEPPAIANGVVFCIWQRRKHNSGLRGNGLRNSSKLRIAASTHATLYALGGETGRELYSSGDQVPTWNHFEELSIANGRVYLGTFDSVLYCFGLPPPAVRQSRKVTDISRGSFAARGLRQPVPVAFDYHAGWTEMWDGFGSRCSARRRGASWHTSIEGVTSRVRHAIRAVRLRWAPPHGAVR